MKKMVVSRKKLVALLESTKGRFFSVRFKRMKEFGDHESMSMSCRIGVKKPRNDNFAVHSPVLFDHNSKLITVFDSNAGYRNRLFKGDYRSFYLNDVEEIKMGNMIIKVVK